MAEVTSVAAASGTSLLLVVVSISTMGRCATGDQNITQHGNNGAFLSPNYPSTYPNNVDVLYIARLDTLGPHLVQLDYVMNIEYHDACSYDYVWLPDLSRKLCSEENGTLYMSVEGDEFNLTFHTDYSQTMSGFNITYLVLQENCYVHLTRDNASHVLLPIPDMETRDSLVFSVRTCDGIALVLSYEEAPKSGYRRKIAVGSGSEQTGYSSLVKSHTPTNTSLGVSVTHATRPLHCCQFNPFWVQWTTSSVAMGTGSTVGSNTMLNETDSFNFTIRFLHMHVGRSAIDLMLDAAFPDSYCESPEFISDCDTLSTTSTITTDNTDVTTPMHDQHITTTSDGALSTTGTEVTTETHTTSTADDVISTTGNKVTTEAHITSTADDVISTTGNKVTTESVTISTVDDVISTTDNKVTTETVTTSTVNDDISTTVNKFTTETHTTSTADDVISTTANKVTTETHATSTADDVISTTANKVTTETHAISTAADVSTTANMVTTETHITFTADGVISTSINVVGTTDDGLISVSPEARTTLHDVTTVMAGTTKQDHVPSTTTTSRPSRTRPSVQAHNREQCWCKCIWQPPPVKINNNDSLTASQAKQAEEERKKKLKAKLVEEIEAKLKVPTSNVSSNARRYVSARDERPSSMYMAMVVGVVCFLPLAVIVLLDVTRLLSSAVRMVGAQSSRG